MKRLYVVQCPACPLVIPHLCFQEKCSIDVGLYVAKHVGVSHPELITSPGEIERNLLMARIEARRN